MVLKEGKGFDLREFPFEKLILVVGLGLILIQVVAYGLNQVFGVGGNVRLGLGFMLLIVLGIITLPYIIMQQKEVDPTQGKVKFIFIFIAAAILLFLLLKFKSLVPEIFEQAVYDLQSILGVAP